MEVVTPVFLLILAGFLAVRGGMLKDVHIDGLMLFTQGIAIPIMLGRALYGLDFAEVFDPGLLSAFYGASVSCFVLGILGARMIFHRRPGEAVAIGFAALFSNSVLLGLAIMERAYGTAALAPNYAIIALHAPANYLLGIAAMEFSRADGRGVAETAGVILRSLARNPLMIGIVTGTGLNLFSVPLPGPVVAAADMVSRAALPAAIFALGGILTRYPFRASLAEAGMVTILSLAVHPAIAWALATQVFDLSQPLVRSAVVTAAMAPGVNAYVFASMYNRATDVAASAILVATGLSVVTASFWLWFLG